MDDPHLDDGEQLQEQVAPPPEVPAPESEAPGIPWGLAASLLIAVLVVVFSVQNTQLVELQFLAWRARAPLAVVVSAVVVAAVLLDEILGFLLRRRRRRRRAERAELARLRRGGS